MGTGGPVPFFEAVLYSWNMRSCCVLAVCVLAIALQSSLAPDVSAQGSRSDLAMAGVQGAGWDAVGFSRFYDAARHGLGSAVVRPPEARFDQAAAPARGTEVELFVGPRPPSRPLIVPNPTATPEYRHTFQILLASPEITDRYDEMILKYAELYHLDARLLKSIVAAESEFGFRALSPRGAQGLMQVMPKTAEEFGIPANRLYEPEFNIAAGAAYVARLFQAAFRKYKLKGVRFRDAPLWLKQRIVAAYNAGPRFLFRDRGWYKQTRDYVRKVLLFYNSSVTDFRRPATTLSEGPRLIARPASGTLY